MLHLVRRPAALARRLCMLAAALPVVLSACKGDNRVRASLPVVADTLVGYALTGGSPSLPSGLATTLRTTVLLDGSGIYDVVFDVDASNNVVLIPATQILNPIAGARSVGLITSATPFADLEHAPEVYYRPDTALTITPGQTAVMLIHRNSGAQICYYLSDPRIFAKIVVDSVVPVGTTARAIYFRQTLNPNCGYRSLVPGYQSN